jgi:hypothetical protein
MAPWLIMTGSGLDVWIYWRLLLQYLLITINYSAIADLPNSHIIRTRSILALILRHTPLYSYSSSVLLHLPASEFDSLIIPRHGPHGKQFPSVVLECVVIGPLPSNGCPIVESVTPGMCLPSRCVTVLWHAYKCLAHSASSTIFLLLFSRTLWVIRSRGTNWSNVTERWIG